jgi:glutathione peroxidase-family protein
MAPDIATQFPTGNQTMNIYDLQMESITGEKISFSDFKDQALLIVNLASQ